MGIDRINRLGQALQIVGDEIQKTDWTEDSQLEVLENIYRQVHSQVCVFCKKEQLCWQEDAEFTYEAFAQACNHLDQWGLQKESCFLPRFQGRCTRAGQVEISLWNQMLQYQQQDMQRKQRLQEKQQIAQQLIAVGEQLTHQEKLRLGLMGSDKQQLLFGYANVQKRGNRLSGDSWGIQELSGGRIVQILSDGMGSGKEANLQSETTVRLLKILLYGGLTVDLALQMVNTILASRFSGERFSTVDLAIWHGTQQQLELIKYGATPSFIKNGKETIIYGGASLPVGILPKIEGCTHRHSLKQGDLLVMMSDGLYELNEPGIFQWEKVISSIPTDNPQLAAEYLMAIATSRSGKKAKDDLTVLVSRLV